MEPFPVIIPEAYACGTPVLGFNRGGVPEGIEHGVTGYITNTVAEMAEDVLRIDRLSRPACRAKAEREYSAEKIAEEYFKLYQPKEYFHNPLKMKILLIMDPGIPVPPPFYGGHERLVSTFANEYKRLGYDVTLLAGPESHSHDKTVTFGVNDLKRSAFQRLKKLLFVWKYLASNKFDTIHNFGRLAYLLPILNSESKKIMTYGRKVTKSGIKLVNKFPNKNLIFTACSNSCVKTGDVAGVWKTVYNAIDFSAYQLNSSIDQAEAPLMYLGRLDRIKGVHTAINVAKATNSKLLIGGNISHTTDNYNYFKNEIEPLIDNEQIKYLGPLNDADKNHFLRQAKALLFPIEWEEPFGMVMVEAMACGTPVIGFKRGSVPEVINEGITGFVVQTESEMIEKIGMLNLIDREVCRKTAEGRFNLNRISKQYLSLFS